MIRAGFAEVDITPRGSVRMDGYVARTGRSTGVLDPIMARACVLEDKLAIVTLDWCWVPRDFAERVRKAVDVPHVLVAATHTHSGPEPRDIVPQIARLIRQARRGAAPCDVRLGRARVTGLGANRRRRGGPHDPDVRVLSFSTTGEFKVALDST